jgi:VWFA-related protein
MKKIFISAVSVILFFSITLAQTPVTPQPQREPAAEDVVRISTSLVQTDLVVTDKNGQVIPDLTADDFKIFDNGKKQDVKFMEFVSAEAGPRIEGELVVGGKPIDPEIAKNLSARELRRVFAFVVDDLTIPFEDVTEVRRLLTDFVDNRMREGDLVAIVRVVGGSGLLQQFTSDRAILRRAIAQISPRLHPFSAFNNLAPDQHISTELMKAAEDDGAAFPAEAISASNTNLDTSNEGINRGFRALITLQVAGEVTNSLKGLPGRKSLVLISGGLPLSEAGPTQITVDGLPITIMETRNYLGNATYLLRQLIDRASRAGVVINTMDIRGLKSSRGVSKFTDPGNEGSSALFGGSAGGGAAFGKVPNMAQFDNLALDTLSSHLGLTALAESTGGVSVINTNNFAEGLDRMLSRSNYYLLAYAPSQAFDNKYHKLEIKVTRPGAKVYSREGYFATADAVSTAPPTKEDAILKAVMSPLARRDVELAGRLQYRFLPDAGAELDINLLVNANNLSFKQDADGKYRATFDVVGFVVNSVGKSQGGFTQTVTASLPPADYQRAQTMGLSYTAHAQLPPGSYQLRAVVRDAESGHMGSISQYIEIPDITKKHMTASSIFLYGIDPATPAKPQPLTALRQLPRQQDLRYAVVIYNPKLTDGKTQLRSQLIVSQGSKIIFQEPDAPVNATLQDGQLVKIGQLGLAKSKPGRYVLTLVITDPQAKKEERNLVRSVDFYLTD